MMHAGLLVLPLALFLSPTAALAQSPSVKGQMSPAPTGSESGLRVGLDFGITAGAAPQSGDYSGTVVGGLGFGLDLGHQLDRSWSLFARAELGTALVSNFAGAYLMVESTPVRNLSIAAGAGAEAGMTVMVDAYAGPAFPLRLSWNFLSEDTWETRGGNDCWRLSLLVVGGLEAIEGQTGFIRGALTLGYAWM